MAFWMVNFWKIFTEKITPVYLIQKSPYATFPVLYFPHLQESIFGTAKSPAYECFNNCSWNNLTVLITPDTNGYNFSVNDFQANEKHK